VTIAFCSMLRPHKRCGGEWNTRPLSESTILWTASVSPNKIKCKLKGNIQLIIEMLRAADRPCLIKRYHLSTSTIVFDVLTRTSYVILCASNVGDTFCTERFRLYLESKGPRRKKKSKTFIIYFRQTTVSCHSAIYCQRTSYFVTFYCPSTFAKMKKKYLFYDVILLP